MPEFVMRDAPDGETYILWDTRTDGCNGYGTRNQLRTYLVKNYSAMLDPDQAVTHVDKLLAYIDETGTSARTQIGPILTGSWEDPRLECKELELAQGWLARDRLIDYARARVAGDLETAASLLEPFEG